MSIPSFEVFEKKFADTLKLKDQNLLKNLLKDIPEYDSLGKIDISLLIEEEFNFQIKYEILDSFETIEKLYKYCKSKFINE